eukprot:GEMP01110796.1.p1 GENE.GEMP01110796.1~~GEMP01110796.1.p1  ORF type:complete len:142 (+),score=26.50 GEMP01110796.1:114-539(+)
MPSAFDTPQESRRRPLDTSEELREAPTKVYAVNKRLKESMINCLSQHKICAPQAKEHWRPKGWEGVEARKTSNDDKTFYPADQTHENNIFFFECSDIDSEDGVYDEDLSGFLPPPSLGQRVHVPETAFGPPSSRTTEYTRR